MQWTDEGIVLGAKRLGEANAVLELVTREHGRHLGLVRGGSSSRLKPILQPGNSVSATWRARLDEHLGSFTVEGLSLRAASFFSSPHAIYGVSHLAALVRLLPERDPHPALYESLDGILSHLDDAAFAAPMVVRFELQLLSDLGFGLDLERCAATGVSGDLVYVSPKSGRAVSRLAGEPWADKMLRLPAFLREPEARPSG
ncbi:MAG: DNA repair protein RecO, partial [Hyphomicrobiales bacterium]